jgi:hypothetical protein
MPLIAMYNSLVDNELRLRRTLFVFSGWNDRYMRQHTSSNIVRLKLQ